MDINRAFEVENGVITNPDQNTDGPFYTGGPSSPVGLDLPERTFYVQNLAGGVIIWRKFSTGANDWRQLSAQDIPFDPSGLLNFEPTDDTVQLGLAKFGMFTLDDLTEAEGFNSLAQETTTSNGWVSKSGFPFTTTTPKTAGQFSVRWSMNVGQTKNARNFGFRVLWRPTGGTFTALSEIPIAAVSQDNSVIMQGGFQEVVLLSDNTIEIDIQFGQTTQGFSAIMSTVSIEVRRIGD